ncbi:hypothetical protein [Nitrogeniibacter aestuarii]|uniref:hypothetical protein n=1 Tax=Nitrogeniibacter aestuarii TaxID=2815343 RepID=UPI001D0F9B6D|nr:hypothetical protein [Nitrogeniibacter aestuarii]
MIIIDVDSLPFYTKQELAEHQLDRAIRLLLDENDAISAITLAGAAEEILGKLVQRAGGTHALADFINECRAAGRLLGENWEPKEFSQMANYYRNELKHYVEGEELTISPDCAHDIIDRAAENLWRLSGKQTEQIRRFMSHVHG